MSPQQYDEVGMSTIEKISRRLEAFYGDSSVLKAPDCEPNASAIINSSSENMSEIIGQSDNNNPVDLVETSDTSVEIALSSINNNIEGIAVDSLTQPIIEQIVAKTPSVDDRTVSKNRKKSKSKGTLLVQHQPKENANNKQNPTANVLEADETDTDDTKDINSSSFVPRKNTPADLPMIIKQAIEHQNASGPSPKIKRLKAMALNINVANQPPPETPAIESAPQSIDFGGSSGSSTTEDNSSSTLIDNALPKVLESGGESKPTDTIENAMVVSEVKKVGDGDVESDFNKAINAMQYEDAFEDKLAKCLDLDKSEKKFSDDDDDVAPEFTSANYWYISPELPLDIDLFREVATLKRQLKSITVNDIYNESMHRDRELTRNIQETVMDDGWQNQLAKLQRTGGLHMNRLCNQQFQQNIVPGFLVRYFVAMVRFNDSVMNMHCVYNFPAVVLTLGPKHWNLARELLLILCDDLQWKIRKTVAVFIYQIGLIIGRELAGKDLVPVFMGFFKDLDEVKIEALRNITNFLQVIDIQHHHKIIFRLGCCLNTDNYANWRFREELAHQVLNLIQIYGNTYNVDGMVYLIGLAINLLSDEVCSVREIALNAASLNTFFILFLLLKGLLIRK